VYRNCRCLQEKYRCAGYVSSRGVVHGYRYNTVLLGLYSGTSVEQRNTYIYIYIYIYIFGDRPKPHVTLARLVLKHRYQRGARPSGHALRLTV